MAATRTGIPSVSRNSVRASDRNAKLKVCSEHIVGARFILQGHRILNSNDESELVQELRDICHASKYNVTVFHPYFIYFDQVTQH